ncbi:hypothetical protein [Rubellicoccus peritrichatus]|uniref:Cadherin domain-containing protein n=1 Tax=Rubellicoccus peritrichatus TaxID=3080537 RepID=A0AAQ3QTW4_9BACT|nr:hypothetical protein [Puniceicoccus sp. CR14]WOO41776.1 hypothetical protein RZN69_01650 [Puniceicoccus sp. CR14]
MALLFLYELRGADNSYFRISSKTLSFEFLPDFESPGDDDGDNIYEVTVIARGSDGSTRVDLEIEVADVNEAPTAPVLSKSEIDENTISVGTVSASDPDGDSVTLSLSGGADASHFDFDASTGALSFKNAPDYENPQDGNGDNSYELTFSATDPAQLTTSNNLVVTVNNVSATPVLSNSEIFENTTEVGIVSASDPGDLLTLSLSGGADASLFDFDPSSGTLAFKNAPDYENPQDDDGDNQYELTFTATDTAQLTTSGNLVVTVNNVSMAPTALTLSINRVVERKRFSVVLSADVEEGESPSFRLTRAYDSDLFFVRENKLHSSFLPNFSIPRDVNSDNVYVVEVIAQSSGIDSEPSLLAITVVSRHNAAPSDPGLSNNTIFENNQTVGTLSTTDPDSDPVYYSITGSADAALFEIVNGDTLAFIEAPDFENPSDNDGNNIYEVSVSATDLINTSGSTLFSITVQDDFEIPATDILLDGESVDQISLEENLDAGTVVSIITAIDSELGDSHTFDLTTTSSGRFEVINGNELAVTGDPQLDHEADNYHVIRIRATDAGGTTYIKRIGVAVTDLDETSVLDRDDYTLDTNTNFIWLHHEHTAGKKLSVIEGRIENETVFGTGFDWQFATWDEYMQFLKNAAEDWTYGVNERLWAFRFPDDYFNQDGLSAQEKSNTFGTLALNRDGSYGGNLFRWANERILYIYPQGDFVDSLSAELRDLRVAYVSAGSEYEDWLQMEGETFTGNRAVMYLIVDRNKGVGFNEWATGQERSTYFDEDENDDGKPNGFDYIFGDEEPMVMLGDNIIQAPSGVWADVILSLEVSTDMTNWTEIVRYEDGVAIYDESMVSIVDGQITYNGDNILQFFRYNASLVTEVN